MESPARNEAFLANAQSIFETAQSALRAGSEISDLSILIGHDGSIRLVTGSDWSLESLQLQHGTRLAYRVRQQSDRVRVEGRAGLRTCLFEAAKPDGAARLLLDNRAWYHVANALPAAP